ncbi:MAG: hypothetical protein L0Y72_03855 [Gemmataceae bacterium]|nr:hypothetical protein [Gemmataceae bacterium]
MREVALTSLALRIANAISQTPLGFNAGDRNLYRYAGNNPTNALDPSGLQGIPDGAMLGRMNPQDFHEILLHQIARSSFLPRQQWTTDAFYLLNNGFSPSEIIEALGAPPPAPHENGRARRPAGIEENAYQCMLDFPRQYDERMDGRAAAAAALVSIRIDLPLTVARTLLNLALELGPTSIVSLPARAIARGYRFVRDGARYVVMRQTSRGLVRLSEREGANFIAQFIPWAAGNPLTTAVRNELRAEARAIWAARSGCTAASRGLQVHHRIPLEYAHLFPNIHPNHLTNLFGVSERVHGQITEAWRVWREGLRGRVPTIGDVLSQAAQIDRDFGRHLVVLP